MATTRELEHPINLSNRLSNHKTITTLTLLTISSTKAPTIQQGKLSSRQLISSTTITQNRLMGMLGIRTPTTIKATMPNPHSIKIHTIKEQDQQAKHQLRRKQEPVIKHSISNSFIILQRLPRCKRHSSKFSSKHQPLPNHLKSSTLISL